MPKSPGNGVSERPRCPACRVELRIRDDKTAPPVFPCPECQVSLRLERSPAGSITVTPADTAVSVKASSKSAVRRSTGAERNPPRPDRTLWWCGAAAAAVAVAVIIGVVRNRAPVPSPTEPVAAEPARAPTEEVPPKVAIEAAPFPGAELAERIRSALETNGGYPTITDRASALPAAQQFSWLARLEASSATLPPERRPAWQAPWFDPANEPFVGRRVASFLNPQVTIVVGEDGRPATHFVGAAGVGRDAVDLPPRHPRAGIFGAQRTVTANDLRDGQANTLMVLGVDAQLGSWADPGRATVRALTQTPYWHGPDGFGGGPEPQIPALMADGSVRIFAADTDPRLLRRLAAINDGLPLDLSIPGEPGDGSPVAAPTIMTGMRIDDPEMPPASALTAVVESQRRVVTRPAIAPLLQQRLVSFEQTKPTTRRQLLLIAEDLLGRPVVFDQESIAPVASQLDAKITFTLENATIAGILEQVLTGTDLELLIGSERAVLRRKTATATSAVRIEP